MNTRELIGLAMRRAIRAEGHTPAKAQYDSAGRCKTCGQPERACPGWHAREDERNAEARA